MTYLQEPSGFAPPNPAPERRDAQRPDAWVGWISFAGIIMILAGTFEAFEGLAALFNDKFFVVTNNGLLVTADYTAWGWVHLILGCVVVAAGCGVFVGKTWARVVGIVLAMVYWILVMLTSASD